MNLRDAVVTGYRGEASLGPAERAGVRVGWTIVGVAGAPVDSMGDIRDALQASRGLAVESFSHPSCLFCTGCRERKYAGARENDFTAHGRCRPPAPPSTSPSTRR
jgi:hypothetical protein